MIPNMEQRGINISRFKTHCKATTNFKANPPLTTQKVSFLALGTFFS
jgi:hypothetical protein